MNHPLTPTLETVDLPDLTEPTVIVVGYAGRDQAAVQHHIDELAAIGVAPPPRVPMLYQMPTTTLQRGGVLAASAPGTSGEVEPVLVRASGKWYLTIGSDHTDRDLERESIPRSKEVCGKPIASSAILLPEGVLEGAADYIWEVATAESWVDGDLYQSGTLAELRPPSDLLNLVLPTTSTSADLVVFGGTFPLLDGVFRPGNRFTATLTVPGTAPIALDYTTTVNGKKQS